MAKQLLIDVLIVLVTPILLIGGYYVFKTDGSELLSVIPSFVGTQNEVDPELGKKTEVALAMLSAIQLDDSLFTDPAYLMLKKYTVQIPSAELGRSNPFTPPQVLIDMNYNGTRIPTGLR
jgi:hypothetical protein